MDEHAQTPFYLARFALKTLKNHVFEGYTDGSRHAGWACPLFTREQAEQVVQAFNESRHAYYDKGRSEFSFQIRSDARHCVGATWVEGLGKVYAIGLRSWMWEEIEN